MTFFFFISASKVSLSMGKKEVRSGTVETGCDFESAEGQFVFGVAALIKPFKGGLKVLEKLMHQVVDTSANDNGGNVVK